MENILSNCNPVIRLLTLCIPFNRNNIGNETKTIIKNNISPPLSASSNFTTNKNGVKLNYKDKNCLLAYSFIKKFYVI